ncbi:MAG: metallophosphoesterase family protein [Herpetosiphon sp.]
MRILILSDVHSNLAALEAVLAAAPQHDELWCLGDTIGYGPQPNECCTLIAQLATWTLTGNHDLACLGAISLADFNHVARIANEWNGLQLDPTAREWLTQRPTIAEAPGALLAHASPRDPIWEYVVDAETAQANLPFIPGNLCFVGHSHLPLRYALQPDGSEEFSRLADNQSLQLDPDVRYIINPGSVGQPRDGDPRASFALWDTDAHIFTLHRVPYDIPTTRRLIKAAGLPTALGDRLAVGR